MQICGQEDQDFLKHILKYATSGLKVLKKIKQFKIYEIILHENLFLK